MRSWKLLVPIICVSALAVFIFCASGRSENTAEKESAEIFALLQAADETGKESFALVREAANRYNSAKDYQNLILFLTGRVRERPADPYNAYYLLMTAHAYIEENSASMAALYFERILKNYGDLFVRGESVHYLCLCALIPLTKSSEKQAWCYEELLRRFPDRVDTGVSIFQLGQVYEKLGDWDKALDAYARLRPYYGLVIPGFADAYSYALRLVDLSREKRKDWTFDSLDAILRRFQGMLSSGAAQRVWQYRAKVNFFVRSWAQQETYEPSESEFNISALISQKVSFETNLAPGSNPNEAYWRTWGWSQLTPIWYFYFRKIYFPPDPEIHGRWEWAGIYYGERF